VVFLLTERGELCSKGFAPDKPVRCPLYHSRIEPSVFSSPFFIFGVRPQTALVLDACARRLKMETADSSETSVRIYETTRSHIQEYLHSHIHRDKHFRFHVKRLIPRMFQIILKSLPARLASAYANENTVAYLLRARIVETNSHY
jgi:hypothetical protein